MSKAVRISVGVLSLAGVGFAVSGSIIPIPPIHIQYCPGTFLLVIDPATGQGVSVSVPSGYCSIFEQCLPAAVENPDGTFTGVMLCHRPA